MKKVAGFWAVVFLLVGLAVFVSGCTSEQLTEDEPQEQIINSQNALRGSGATNLCYTETQSAWRFSSGQCGIWSAEGGIHYVSCGVAAEWCRSHDKSATATKYNANAVKEITRGNEQINCSYNGGSVFYNVDTGNHYLNTSTGSQVITLETARRICKAHQQ